MNADRASDIAIHALQFIAGNEEELGRFLALSGIRPDEIRAIAGTAGFQASVLDYLLGHEPTLLSFAASAAIDARDVLKARQVLVPDAPQEGW